METAFFNQRFKVGSLLLTVLLLAGCTTNFFKAKPSPFQTYLSPGEYLKVAEEAPPLQALVYRLRAAELCIKNKEIPEAQQVLRETRAQNIDLSVHKSILGARLALLNRDNSKALSLIKSALNTLNYQYSQAANALETSGEHLRIALLLPSEGPHAEAAKTVRDGFLAAYYQSLHQKASDPSVKIYDTGDGNKAREAYFRAIADKANFIVGPLTKAELQTLVHLKLEVPVLALNTISEDTSLPYKLYQFGLMPEDEVIAVAQQALRQGRQNALILAPQNEWGQRLAQTFKYFWKSQRGSVVDMQFFKSSQDVEEKIRMLLKVREKEKERRQDVDMIFMAASPELARHIKSLLNFYYAENLPVYATSSIYAGTPVSNRDQNLNGIRFCDMPWILQSSSQIQEAHQAMEKISPRGAMQSPRFFALGMDAYQLASQLGRSNHLPSYGISGYTGNLHLNGYQRIERGLVCAKFEQGIPVPD